MDKQQLYINLNVAPPATADQCFGIVDKARLFHTECVSFFSGLNFRATNAYVNRSQRLCETDVTITMSTTVVDMLILCVSQHRALFDK